MMPARRDQNWLPSIFNEIFGNEWMERSNRTAPAVNIIENEDDYCVEVAAPGMTREDFKININEDNELVISMEKRTERQQGEAPRQEQEQRDEQTQPGQRQDGNGRDEQRQEDRQEQNAQPRKQGTYLRREFSYSQFQQSFILPDNVDKEKIRARMENGVLTIDIPKRKEEEMVPASRQIDIE